MFCFKCGAKIPDESAFCMKCGAKMPVMDEEPEPAPAPKPAAPQAPAWPPEDAVIVPKEIAESDDRDKAEKWFEKHKKNDVFAAEQGTTRLLYVKGNVKSFYIPDSVTEIGDFAFSDCWSLTSITIPNSVTEIGDAAFRNCKSLTSITIPESVTKIGRSAFSSCESLTSITIPNSVTKIGERAFQSCESLTSVSLPNSITQIFDGTFSGCKSLTSIKIPKSVSQISGAAFNGETCASLTTIYVPSECKIYYNDFHPYEKIEDFFSCPAQIIRY